ncbi:MAG: hypothetical protein J2P32_17720 [Actinobacteria bacterium]|nr:hypothetical protein [Actinomycetota bacterium]
MAEPEPLLPVADEPRGSSMFRVRDIHVLFSDQRWHDARVLGWARGESGSWLLLIRWRDGRSDWRKYDPRLVHPR